MTTRVCTLPATAVVAGALFMLCCGCGPSGSTAVPPTGSSGTAPAFSATASLPRPSQLTRQASAASGVELAGSAFSAALPNPHVVVSGTAAVFSPDWTPAAADPAGLAYALYEFDTTSFSGAPVFGAGWDVAPASGLAWVALGDRTTDTWRWFALPDTWQADCGTLAPYIAGDGGLLAVVVVLGTAEALLNQVWLGERQSGYYETEDNDDWEYADLLPELPFPDPRVNGSIGAVGDYPGYDGDTADWYEFEMAAAGLLRVSCELTKSGGSGNLSVDLYYDNAGVASSWFGSNTDSTVIDFVRYSARTGRNWICVSVSDPEGGTPPAGDYELSLGWTAVNYYETENNDSPAEADVLPALPIGWGAVCGSVGATAAPDTGEVVYDGDSEDWYSFTVGAPGAVAVELRGTRSTNHEIYDSDGTTVLASKIGVFNPDRSVVYLDHAGSYYIRVLDNGSSHSTYQLIVETGTNLGWVVETVTDDYVPWSYDLTEVDGRPGITWYCDDVFDLAFSRAVDATGTDWPEPVKRYLTDGDNLSLALANGRPAIAYMRLHSASDRTVEFQRSGDSYGSTWDPPQELLTGSADGQGISLAVIEGNPAIAYYSVYPDCELQFLRATNVDGTAWGTPVTVQALGAGDVNFRPGRAALAVVDGNPAIAYVTHTGAVSYIRASDTDGTSWGTPVSLFSAVVWEPVVADLAVVDGNPALTYYADKVAGGNAAQSCFIRALDTTGEALWGTPYFIEYQTDVINLSAAAIAIDDGLPVLAYYSYGEVTVLRGADAAGTLWGASIMVEDADITALPGSPPALAVCGGHLGLAYPCRLGGGFLRYACWY